MKPAFLAAMLLSLAAASCTKTYDLADYGLVPDSGENASPLVYSALKRIKAESGGRNVRIVLPAGRYDFHADGAASREYYISNHDQPNPKAVGIVLEDMRNVTFDGQGAELVFHGRMLPVAIVDCRNCTLRNLSVDFANPHISQVRVTENDPDAGTITYEVAPWVEYEIRDSMFVAKGEGWEHVPALGMAFEGDTKRVVYNTGDIGVGTRGVVEVAPRTIRAPWRNTALVEGTVVVFRGYGRPAPGIFLYRDSNAMLKDVTVHYAEGMGLLAQVCDGITLDGFSVALRGADDPRYFTTQADATHFSGCKGRIVSRNGLYENMMDDAINVHGTYLKVVSRENDRTLMADYMHGQSYGFVWGHAGDEVQFIASRRMEVLDGTNVIASIEAVDNPVDKGVKRFRIAFEQPLDENIGRGEDFGIENLEWTPEVYFADNVIRNNRARGALFSTPRRTLVEGNLFDHTSGTAILLCGDCNGWFETGACRDVTIRRNRFVNALTSMYQFTNAVISIYPEVPDLPLQERYFHSGIVIEDNEFDTFDVPILFARSVDGLVFRRNVVRQNDEYAQMHWNTHRFLFERVKNDVIGQNEFAEGAGEYDVARE